MLDRECLEILGGGAMQLGIDLSVRQLQQFSIYTDVLLDWNSKFNLTRITDPREIVIKHFLDSLTCLTAMEFPLDAKVIDVGSGAGFPGVPVEIARPDVNMTLLDSTHKRLAFLEELATELELSGVSLLHGRAEEAGHDLESREYFDIAVVRAVGRLNLLAEYCLPLVRIGGWAIAQKGPDVQQELAEASHAIKLLGGEAVKVTEMTLPHSAIRRSLIILRKVAKTPAAYPRKPAAIQREPL